MTRSKVRLFSLIIALAGLAVSPGMLAQQTNTEHTFKLADSKRPAAKLKDVAWLVGSWQGTAFGNSFEEVWNPPSAGSMVGMFKVFNDEDGVSFYEIMLLIEEENSLSLRVKHFTADFIAWETKEKYVSFPLVKIEQDAIHFSGLSFYRTGEDTIDGYIALKSSEGDIREEKMVYVRSKSGN